MKKILSLSLFLATSSAFALPFQCPSISDIQKNASLLEYAAVQTVIAANGMIVTIPESDSEGRTRVFANQKFASHGKQWSLMTKTGSAQKTTDELLRDAQMQAGNTDKLLQKWDMEFLGNKSDTFVCAYKDANHTDEDDPTVFAYVSVSKGGSPLDTPALMFKAKK